MKPIFKWAGNKYSLAPQLLPFIPSGRRYIEPFVGAGGLFCALVETNKFETYWLNDLNPDLMSFYTQLKEKGLPFMEAVGGFFNHFYNREEDYYCLRETFNKMFVGHPDRAVMLPYFNKHGFNGLIRYNQQGGFNVPYGRYKSPYLPMVEMELWHIFLQNTLLTNMDFEKVLLFSEEGDVVYCDPPYHPLSNTSNFTSYQRGWRPGVDDERLARTCYEAKERGVQVIVSAPHIPKLHEIFYKHGASFYTVGANRHIAANALKRKPVLEYVIVM